MKTNEEIQEKSLNEEEKSGKVQKYITKVNEAEGIIKSANHEAYKGVKDEMNDVIDANEKKIKELKEKLKGKEKQIESLISSEIDQLDKKNTALKNRIEDFKSVGKEKEESFKKELKHDIDELGHAIHDLFVKNIK